MAPRRWSPKDERCLNSQVMALMRALHPLAFIRVKQQLAASPSRPKLRADKDALQARVVQALWDEHLCLLERGAQA